MISPAGTGLAGAFALKHPLLDQDKAQRAADARQNELDRAKVEARAELALGDPSVTADGVMALSGFRKRVDGTYGVTSVEHDYDSAGYPTSIVAEGIAA